MFKQDRYKIENEWIRVTETKNVNIVRFWWQHKEPRNCSENAYCTSEVRDVEVDNRPRTALKVAVEESPVVDLRPEIYVMALTTWRASF